MLRQILWGLTGKQREADAKAERDRIAAINAETEQIKSKSREYKANRAKEAQKKAAAWKAEQEGWYKNRPSRPVETAGYTPEKRTEYWDRPEWGSTDVIRTPPREKPKKEDNPYRPQIRGIERDQRDYAYMPTETEVRREDERWTREQKAQEYEPWQQRPDPGTEFMGHYVRKPPTLIIK